MSPRKDMFITKRHCSVPKIMQIGSGIVKMWTVKYSGLDFVFWATMCFPCVYKPELGSQGISSLLNKDR